MVSKCVHRDTNHERACKKVPRKKIKNMDRFKQEILILQKLDHPNVLRIYEYFEDDKNIYLITELCKGGELFDKIIQEEYFSEKEAARLFKQVLLSLNYCHHQGIAHRDLKPENFLFETKDAKSDLKIIDFGLSKIVKTNAFLEGGALNPANKKRTNKDFEPM